MSAFVFFTASVIKEKEKGQGITPGPVFFVSATVYDQAGSLNILRSCFRLFPYWNM